MAYRMTHLWHTYTTGYTGQNRHLERYRTAENHCL